jgi:hypothetical protein
LRSDGLFYKYQSAFDFVMAYQGNLYKTNDERDLGGFSQIMTARSVTMPTSIATQDFLTHRNS